MNQKKLLITPILLILLATPVLSTINVDINMHPFATKYRTHGAKLNITSPDWNKEENTTLTVSILDKHGTPIKQYYKYTDQETGQPNKYNTGTRDHVKYLTFYLDQTYQKGRNYTLAITTGQDSYTQNFQVTDINQPDWLGDFILTMSNQWILMSIVGLFILLFLAIILYKITIGLVI